MTRVLAADADGFAAAAALLRSGLLTAFPTETVYGLGGDASSDSAVARIFEAKGRPRFNPLIVHVPHIEAARTVAVFDDRAERLAAAFWPGPLTLVLPLRADSKLSRLVTSDLPTVAVRVPAHPVAQRLMQTFGSPLAAPSANLSGKISPTRAEHVLHGLAGRIAAVIDGGSCMVGIESTILSLAGPSTILRSGGIPAEALEACLGHRPGVTENGERPTSPGQLPSHYAPDARLRLNAHAPGPEEIFIGFGEVSRAGALNLSASGDIAEAAANLFDMLRKADRMAGASGMIAVAPVPEKGLGQAINDRLRRAAAPRG